MTTLVLQLFTDCPLTRTAIGDRLEWSFAGNDAHVKKARETLLDIVQQQRDRRIPETKQEGPEK